jgi:hypothetical protein
MKEISTCYKCGKPVVWTFAFDGYEYYCLMCGNKTGMLGGKNDVKSTPELRAWRTMIERLWKVLRQNHIGNGRYRKDKCKKCANEDHGKHFSKSEIEKGKVADTLIELLSQSI